MQVVSNSLRLRLCEPFEISRNNAPLHQNQNTSEIAGIISINWKLYSAADTGMLYTGFLIQELFQICGLCLALKNSQWN